MKTIGKPNSITKPIVAVRYKGRFLDLSSASITYAVGRIATADMGVPPESLGDFFSGQNDVTASIEVGDGTGGSEPLFTGYAAGPTAMVSGSALRFGMRMIHPARDLDQGRTWSPYIHPMSNDDYSNYMAFQANSGHAVDGFENIRGIDFDLTGNIVDGAKSTIERALRAVLVSPKWRVGNISHDPRSIEAALAMIGKVEAHGPCKIDVGNLGDAEGPLGITARQRVQAILWGSVTSMTSTWDLMSMLLATFGLTMICTRDGGILAMPDFSGVKPPKENFANGDIITTASAEASFTRNLSQVVILSYGLPMNQGTGKSGAMGDVSAAQIQGHASLVATYPEKVKTGSKGATYVTALPSWMIPTSRSGGAPELPQELLLKYAKHTYSQVLHQGRSFAVSGPLVPDAKPGTTLYFSPISALKAFSGQDLPTDSVFSGYCYKVNHTIDAQSKVVQTTFYMRNIYTSEEFDEQLDSPALFAGDKPPVIN